MFRHFATLGGIYGRNYGMKNKDDQDDNVLLNSMTDAQKTNCLLSSLVGDLSIMRVTMENILEHIRKPQDITIDEPSDGMLKAFRCNTGEIPVLKADGFEKLSVLARLAIARSGVVFVSDINRDRLTGTRGCGIKTRQELQDFRKLNDSSYEFT